MATLSLTIKQRQSAMAAIFLAAYDNYLDAQDESYYESEKHIDMFNHVGELASAALGFNVSEDVRWTNATANATNTEINTYTIEQLLLLLGMQDQTGPLYTVLCEYPSPIEHREAVDGQIDTFDLFGPEQLTVDAGWDGDQVEWLNSRKVGQMLSSYGDFCHNLIRIR